MRCGHRDDSVRECCGRFTRRITRWPLLRPRPGRSRRPRYTTIGDSTATAEIDQQLRAQIRALQEHRRRIAQLASGDSLALPVEVVDYLDRLRAAGATEAVIAPERDAWILMAARWPEAIPAVMADKMAQLDDPRVVRLYQLIGRVAENWQDEELLRETADLMSELLQQAGASGELDSQDDVMPDEAFIGLMDSFADASHPVVARLRVLMAERGWTGWTRLEKLEP